MQAEADSFREELAAETAADAANAPADARSEWGERCEEEEGRWRRQSPSIGAAVVQLHAAPDPQAACFSCKTQGCTIRCAQSYTSRHCCCCAPGIQLKRRHVSDTLTCRCSSCCPAVGCVFLCEACDKELHTHVHMHRRQSYSDNCWTDLPQADPENGGLHL
jgi:hypothetical protein